MKTADEKRIQLVSEYLNDLDLDNDLSEYYRKRDRKSTRLNSSHIPLSRMPSSA